MWVMDSSEQLILRPLIGGESSRLVLDPVLLDYLASKFPYEAIAPSSFDPPSTDSWVGNHSNFLLFQNASRLLLREGVTPFRSLAKVNVRPRPYQLVPLLMSMKLDPVRMLIADDVGVGKTIEAGLIVRELLEARAAKRVAVLAPPHLMEQWVRELSEKFALDPVPVSPATLGGLERSLPQGKSVYAHYPVQVISIDFIKQGSHRSVFLRDAPDLIVVDEAHGVTGGINNQGHLRYELVSELAKDPNRHLLLLTATPHSGIPEAFKRLLGFLDKEFESWDLDNLDEKQRDRLALHFVQRTRGDVLETWGGQRLFPKREVRNEEYLLSEGYRRLYEGVYRYATELVRSSMHLEERRRRRYWWGILNLLRATMSSPQAAFAALSKRGRPKGEGPEVELDEDADLSLFAFQTYEASDAYPDDEIPTPLIQKVLKANDSSLAKLQDLAKRLEDSGDTKAQKLIAVLRELLQEGHSPVVWCHFVDTADYLGRVLKKLFPDVEIGVVTGRLHPELRRQEIERLSEFEGRILVATDCVSEGVNLQKSFSACVHYDLPWNPNRLEQREGRVDRYGQPKEKVVVVRYMGSDNPVDKAVEEVLLRKAEKIRQDLGIHVPVPREEDYVVNRMVYRLFYQQPSPSAEQIPLFTEEVALFKKAEEAETAWDMDIEREKRSRSRFAQRAIRPEEVMEVLGETDSVLGDPQAVKDFFLAGFQLLGVNPKEKNGAHVLDGKTLSRSETLPELVRAFIPDKKTWAVAFDDPVPEGAELVGRNHPVIVALARYVYEGALGGKTEGGRRTFGRWTALRTPEVERAVYLYLFRPRYRMNLGGGEVLGEEVIYVAREGFTWLMPKEAERFARLPFCGEVPRVEAEEHLGMALELYRKEEGALRRLMEKRAQEVRDFHRKVRRAARMRTGDIRVEFAEMDLLGVKILLPKVGGR